MKKTNILAEFERMIAEIERGDHVLWDGDDFLKLLETLRQARESTLYGVCAECARIHSESENACSVRRCKHVDDVPHTPMQAGALTSLQKKPCRRNAMESVDYCRQHAWMHGSTSAASTDSRFYVWHPEGSALGLKAPEFPTHQQAREKADEWNKEVEGHNVLEITDAPAHLPDKIEDE